MPEAAITERAPAKLNLFLHILGRRDDGYHILESLVVFPDLHDVLHARLDKDLSLTVVGEFATDAGAGGTNLVMKAARFLQEKTGAKKGAALTLTKNIPVGGGLGGGSADAAATLRALNRLWELQLTPDALRALALPLGADVAMCIDSKPAIARGIGEQLTPLAAPLPRCHVVLVHPRVKLLTADVYRALTLNMKSPMPSAIPSDYKGFIATLAATNNDLTAAALKCVPAVGEVLDALAPRADLVRMSGSGACCFALYEKETDAQDAAQVIRAQHPNWWVKETKLVTL